MQGSPGTIQTTTQQISKKAGEEDGDVRLSRYIWSTIRQLKNEGYPIDIDMFQNFTSSTHGSVVNTIQMDDDKQAFSNKRIQKANILDLDERWQQSRLGSTSYLQRDKRKGSVKPNADLNFAFKEDLTR